jgi:hypothetical protein
VAEIEVTGGYLLITGTRRDTRAGVVSEFLEWYRPIRVVVGDATGVDAEAREWCVRNGVPCTVELAVGPWPAAGPARNKRLLDTLLFLAGPEPKAWVAVPDRYSRGTHHCRRLCEQHGLAGQVI